MSGSFPVGIYGKIETQADFYRAGAGEFSQAGLDGWFESALETMRGEGSELPPGPTGFLLAPRGVSRVFVGAFASSRDGAGRTFPLVVFSHFDPAARRDGLSQLFSANSPFVAAAGTLATQGGHMAVASLVEGAQTLAAADWSSDSTGPGTFGQDVASFSEHPAESLRAAMGGSPRALAYALRTVGLACEQGSKYGPDANSGVITVDAPIPNPASAWMWLEIVARRLRWQDALPSLLWPIAPAAEKERRLLLMLGPPSAAALGFLANARHRSSKFWPLRTEVAAAIDQAWQSLSPEQRALLERPHTSLGQLLDAFDGRTGGPAVSR